MKTRYWLPVLLALVLFSCHGKEEISYSADPVDNIEALWQIIDTRYCYVEEKGCDWTAIHDEYIARAQTVPENDQVALFDLCAAMLDSLHDGHVNLYSAFDRSYNTAWFDTFPADFDARIQALYLNNYRNDTTTQVLDKIVIVGATEEPTYTVTKRTLASHTTTEEWDAETGTFTLNVKHLGALDVTINCTGTATERSTDTASSEPLTEDLPKQPEDYNGEIIIEAENLDRKDVGSVALTHSGWWAQNVKDFAGMGYVDLGTKARLPFVINSN